jgi:hypothetical protein
MAMSPFNILLTFCVAALAHTGFRRGNANQVSRTGSFDLPCSADTAFPLFSPEGERDWVKDWDPRPIFPDRIEFRRDTVFREGDGDEEAVWTILDADLQTHRAEYVRLAPASHSAHIVVTIEPLGPERSHVVVSYTVTAFGEHAPALLEAFSESAYAQKMRNWQRQITEYLERHKSRPGGVSAPWQSSEIH